MREICYATGFLGGPVSDWIDTNPALFTDFWLEYHFRREPESIWVAEADGRVIGYVTGCRDTRAKARFMAGPFLLHAVRALCHGRYRMGRRTLGMLGRLLLDGVTGRWPRRPSPRAWPATLHYNVLPDFRGAPRRCGLRLASCFVRRLIETGIAGCCGLVVMQARNKDQRYGLVGRLYDVKATRVFRRATPEPLYLATLTFDLRDEARRRLRHALVDSH